MGWKVYLFIFVGKSILSFISTWLRFSYTCHKGCLNTWLGDRKLREAKLRCFFKASKTVASPTPSHDLRSTDHVCKFKERYHPHPTPPQSHDLRSTDHVCKCKERYHPHPTPPQPHPIPWCCVAPTMCASSRNVIIPTPPHPNPMPCVAPTMCASARNVIIPTPPHPMMLRSTDHACVQVQGTLSSPPHTTPIPWLA